MILKRAERRTGAGALASILDAASDGGAESWHFLGGNPDESLVGILEALRMTQSTRPVVWNSALYVTPEGLKLLKGLVDVCTGPEIWQRPVRDGTRRHQPLFLRHPAKPPGACLSVSRVRHMSYPGHEHCCADFVSGWVRENLPNAVMNPSGLCRCTDGGAFERAFVWGVNSYVIIHDD